MMQFYSHSIGGPSYLVLHKDEWTRLKKKAGPSQTVPHDKECLKALTEQSQAWIRTWPDTVQGHVARLKKQKERQKAKELATIDAFAIKKARDDTTEAVKKARQKIFEESNYGNQLLAALHQSKCLEEIDVQVEFLKQLKQEAAKRNQKLAMQEMSRCSFGLDENEEAVKQENKRILVEYARQNKATHKKQTEDRKREADEEKMLELTDAHLMEQLLEKEKEAHETVQKQERQLMAEYAAEHTKIKAERAERQAQQDRKIEECKKKKDQLEYKIKQTLKQIYGERLHDTKSKQIYDIIKKHQEKGKKRYNDFIDKQIEKEVERVSKEDAVDREKAKQDHETRLLIAETNTKLSEHKRMLQSIDFNKCFCDKQCVLPKAEKEKRTTLSDPEVKCTPYFRPYNSLIASLKKREKEPPSYTGASTFHEQFAKEAEITLADCKYKIPGRKVVDEYRKQNCLDAGTLPIRNYYDANYEMN